MTKEEALRIIEDIPSIGEWTIGSCTSEPLTIGSQSSASTCGSGVGSICGAQWPIAVSGDTHSITSTPYVTPPPPLTDDEAKAYFRSLKPSLRERFIDDTTYAEAAHQMSAGNWYMMPQRPTRFSSEELQRMHVDALLEAHLKEE